MGTRTLILLTWATVAAAVISALWLALAEAPSAGFDTASSGSVRRLLVLPNEPTGAGPKPATPPRPAGAGSHGGR